MLSFEYLFSKFNFGNKFNISFFILFKNQIIINFKLNKIEIFKYFLILKIYTQSKKLKIRSY